MGRWICDDPPSHVAISIQPCGHAPDKLWWNVDMYCLRMTLIRSETPTCTWWRAGGRAGEVPVGFREGVHIDQSWLGPVGGFGLCEAMTWAWLDAVMRMNSRSCCCWGSTCPTPSRFFNTGNAFHEMISFVMQDDASSKITDLVS